METQAMEKAGKNLKERVIKKKKKSEFTKKRRKKIKTDKNDGKK